jgi:hypothetical protein
MWGRLQIGSVVIQRHAFRAADGRDVATRAARTRTERRARSSGAAQVACLASTSRARWSASPALTRA